MEEEKKPYLIPSNVNTKFQFFEGYGWKELFITLIIVAITVLLYFVFGFIGKLVGIDSITFILIRVFIGILVIGFSIAITIPDPRTRKSLLILLKDYKQFTGKQRRYLYRYGYGREEN